MRTVQPPTTDFSLDWTAPLGDRATRSVVDSGAATIAAVAEESCRSFVGADSRVGQRRARTQPRRVVRQGLLARDAIDVVGEALPGRPAKAGA